VSTLNVAIIGCGNLGGRHAKTLARLPDVAVVALVDRDLARATQLRQVIEVDDARVTDDVQSVLSDPAIHAVVIATHHDSHPDLAIASARARKHVFVEKPLALTNAACREVEATVDAAGVQLLVGFQARHAPFVRRAREWVPRPRVVVGQIVAGRWGDASWAQQPDVGGGNVLSQGVHGFDLLAYAAGAAPVNVFAAGGTLTHDPRATTVIDSVLATIRFANGVVGSAVIGDFGPSPWTLVSFYEFFDGAGRSATLPRFFEELCLGSAGSRVSPLAPEREPARYFTVADLPPAERDDPHGYAALIAEFARCARENRPPTVGATVRDGRRATAVALACFESIRTGQPVALEDERR
jgi:myo-inositol 2-dehydrogenase/D-chiro-inositol 1-dehydrogenase